MEGIRVESLGEIGAKLERDFQQNKISLISNQGEYEVLST